MATHDELYKAAIGLYQAVVAMEIKGDYNDDARHQTIHDLMAVLRPVRDELGFIGSGPTNTAPARLWHGPLKDFAHRAQAFLKANPDWTPPGRNVVPTRLHPRLHQHIRHELEIAQQTEDGSAWEKVAHESLRFLETDLRLRIVRAGRTPPKGREAVAGAAMRETDGPARLGADDHQRKHWRMLAQGLLVALGNEGAHLITEQSSEVALGIAGAVSLILTALDQEHGPTD